MKVVEIDVHSRARLHGQSSLTRPRLLIAAARVILAMIVVPFRARVTPDRGAVEASDA